MARPLLAQLAADSDGRLRLPLRRALAGLSPAARKLLLAVASEAKQRGLPLYVVGGFVRDLLLGRAKLDLDLVVEGDAIAFGRTLTQKLGGKLLPHSTFRTAVWALPKNAGLDFIDLVSARRERYAHPGALPEVELANIHDDQYRRDFSINTLALRLDGAHAGEVLDPLRGVADLKAKTLRVLHHQSFADDPTRILRILRFAGRLKFKIHADTLTQLRASVPLLAAISGERIYNELVLAFLEPERVAILQSMQRYGVLSSIQHGLQFNSRIASSLKLLPAPAKMWDVPTFSPSDLGFVLWLAQHSPAVAAAVAERLRFTAELSAAASSAARLRTAGSKLAALRASALTPKLEGEPALAVYALHLLNKSNKLGRKLTQYAKTWRHVQPSTDGHALQNLGIKPGPAYGRILSALRAAKLDGKIKTKKQERTLLEKLLHEQH